MAKLLASSEGYFMNFHLEANDGLAWGLGSTAVDLAPLQTVPWLNLDRGVRGSAWLRG